jgi:hypothetical protein
MFGKIVHFYYNFKLYYLYFIMKIFIYLYMKYLLCISFYAMHMIYTETVIMTWKLKNILITL